MIGEADIDEAAERIRGHVRRTPLVTVDGPGADGEVLLKLEQLQRTGSFKARGAVNRVRSALERDGLPEAGVIAASGGNAGLAVAHAARSAGARAEIFVPETAPEFKVAALRELGAEVVQVGRRYAEAAEACQRRAAETGALFCHAYDQPEIVAGQATLGRELLEQAPGGVDTVLVAVGGGGLAAGIAAAVHERARVVAVEPATAPTLHDALTAGRPVDVDVSGVAADSLGATRVGEIAFDVAERTGVRSVLVDDDAIRTARRELWQRYRQVVEQGTAAAFATLLTGAHRPEPGERTAVVLCGANTDPTG